MTRRTWSLMVYILKSNYFYHLASDRNIFSYSLASEYIYSYTQYTYTYAYICIFFVPICCTLLHNVLTNKEFYKHLLLQSLRLNLFKTYAEKERQVNNGHLVVIV